MQIERNHLIDVYVGSPTSDAIECRSTIPLRAPVFEYQHTDPPTLPAALMIEIMAQASGFIHMLKTDFASMLYLANVMSAEFHSQARPGEAITIRSEVLHWGDGFIVCDARIDCDAGLRALVTSKLMLKCEPFLSDSMRSAFVSVLPADRTGPVTLTF
jgi:3-hydroxymyristoyl/3-hydroxydecanoyl-(acyl carrier protein) dehydratase